MLKNSLTFIFVKAGIRVKWRIGTGRRKLGTNRFSSRGCKYPRVIRSTYVGHPILYFSENCIALFFAKNTLGIISRCIAQNWP